MSGQVRWKGRFINNKTLGYEVRRNTGLVEARKRKYSGGNFTYASKLVLCECACVYCLTNERSMQFQTIASKLKRFRIAYISLMLHMIFPITNVSNTHVERAERGPLF